MFHTDRQFVWIKYNGKKNHSLSITQWYSTVEDKTLTEETRIEYNTRIGRDLQRKHGEGEEAQIWKFGDWEDECIVDGVYQLLSEGQIWYFTLFVGCRRKMAGAQGKIPKIKLDPFMLGKKVCN